LQSAYFEHEDANTITYFGWCVFGDVSTTTNKNFVIYCSKDSTGFDDDGDGRWKSYIVKFYSAKPLSATPSKTNFQMNGKSIDVPQAYNVKGNNYLQLRAIAELLNGTEAQFNVDWDGTYAVIETGKPFTGTTNPATLQDTTNVKVSTTEFKIDGQIVTFAKVYKIDGDTNYLQLREFAEKLRGTKSQFNVYWDEELKIAVIEPGKEYTGVKYVV